MADLSLVSKSVADILGFQATAAQDTAAATGQGFAAFGGAAEAGAYGSAVSIAQQNAQLAGVAGQIQEYQSKREAAKTIGAEQADVAGAGFKNSGSNLAALRSSFQQSYLSDQLIRTQTQMTQGGYLEQAAAGTAEQAAALAAAGGAEALQKAYTTAAGTAKTNAANETAGLLGFIQNSGTPVTQFGKTTMVGSIAGTPEANLITSTLSGSTLPASWMSGAFNPITTAAATLPNVQNVRPQTAVFL